MEIEPVFGWYFEISDNDYLSADNSLKLNLRSICVSCCKIDIKLNCIYKDEIKLFYVLTECMRHYLKLSQQLISCFLPFS